MISILFFFFVSNDQMSCSDSCSQWMRLSVSCHGIDWWNFCLCVMSCWKHCKHQQKEPTPCSFWKQWHKFNSCRWKKGIASLALLIRSEQFNLNHSPLNWSFSAKFVFKTSLKCSKRITWSLWLCCGWKNYDDALAPHPHVAWNTPQHNG